MNEQARHWNTLYVLHGWPTALHEIGEDFDRLRAELSAERLRRVDPERHEQVRAELAEANAHRVRLAADLVKVTDDRDMWQELCAQMGDGWTEVREVIGVRPGEAYLSAAQRLRAERNEAIARLRAVDGLPERWLDKAREWRDDHGTDYDVERLEDCANELSAVLEKTMAAGSAPDGTGSAQPAATLLPDEGAHITAADWGDGTRQLYPTPTPDREHSGPAQKPFCRCCPSCCDYPCAGVEAGGMCDERRCRCDDEPDSDDYHDVSDDDDGNCACGNPCGAAYCCEVCARALPIDHELEAQLIEPQQPPGAPPPEPAGGMCPEPRTAELRDDDHDYQLRLTGLRECVNCGVIWQRGIDLGTCHGTGRTQSLTGPEQHAADGDAPKREGAAPVSGGQEGEGASPTDIVAKLLVKDLYDVRRELTQERDARRATEGENALLRETAKSDEAAFDKLHAMYVEQKARAEKAEGDAARLRTALRTRAGKCETCEGDGIMEAVSGYDYAMEGETYVPEVCGECAGTGRGHVADAIAEARKAAEADRDAWRDAARELRLAESEYRTATLTDRLKAARKAVDELLGATGPPTRNPR